MYDNAKELLAEAQKAGLPIHKVVQREETALTGASGDEVRRRALQTYGVMKQSAQAALNGLEHLKRPTMISGSAQKMNGLSQCVSGAPVQKAAARSLSCSEVNASMGKICAAPTAGACGVLPAVVITVAEEHRLDDEKAVDGLLTASGIGAIIMNNATVSGARGGCQAECGAAAAMAAAAAACMMGGTNEMQLWAASLALINAMGLICDPVGGLVQIPCAYRNATQAANALLCADMALSGIDPLIPLDDSVSAMAEVGEMLPPALRETAKGGVAATPSGQALAEKWNALSRGE